MYWTPGIAWGTRDRHKWHRLLPGLQEVYRLWGMAESEEIKSNWSSQVPEVKNVKGESTFQRCIKDDLSKAITFRVLEGEQKLTGFCRNAFRDRTLHVPQPKSVWDKTEDMMGSDPFLLLGEFEALSNWFGKAKIKTIFFYHFKITLGRSWSKTPKETRKLERRLFGKLKQCW